jgi:chromate reductase, NAD(P)H dehydrogenase (quinone)
MTMFVFGASLRARSYNAALARLAARELVRKGVEVDLASLKDFDAPLYDQDLLDARGFPAGVRAFTSRLRRADAFAIASPEYTFSIPGPLKNLIDWSSQAHPLAWTGKPGLLLSASVSRVGGERGLWALRVPLEALGAHLFPRMFSLPDASDLLGHEGEFTEAEQATRLAELVHAFVSFADTLTR